MALNLKSAFLCVRAVWEEMAARKTGCIINVSSMWWGGGGLSPGGMVGVRAPPPIPLPKEHS